MNRSNLKKFFNNKDNILLILTITAVIMGLSIGLIIRSLVVVPAYWAHVIGFPGEILMNMFKMVIIPLIVSSIITALANLDLTSSAKVGAYTMTYYLFTTLMAVIIGIILVVSIHPGDPTVKDNLEPSKPGRKIPPKTLDAFLDLIRNIFPVNLISSCFRQASTFYVLEVEKILLNGTLKDVNITNIRHGYQDATNILGLLSFSIVFGLVIGNIGKEADVLIKIFHILNIAIMKIVNMIMWYSPFGIMFLIMGKIIEIRDLRTTVQSLGWYMLTVLLGLLIHAGIVLNLLYFIIVRKNPALYFRGMLQAVITALGTSSSSATLPVTIKCVEEINQIDKRISRLVLPIGATINMDGTALYEAVASIFIAQINAIPLNFGQILTISITATLAAVGAASIPSGGLITMIIVLTSVGLPIDDISLLISVDWLLDRFRTAVNVLGDAYGAGIVGSLCQVDSANTVLPVDNQNEQVL